MTDATSDLQQSLGLAVDPFGPQALPDFFFVGGQRRYLAQRAVHALYFTGGIVLLSGARGSGKSRMLDEILVDLRDLTDNCRIDATVMMDGVDIRRVLITKLGLPATAMQDNTALIVALTHWRPAGRDPQPVALIIDDAQLLAVPALADCLQLAGSSGGRLRLLLAGEPDLVAACQQAGAEAIERIELPPLDRQETADYVATRLQAAGYRAESPLSPTQLRDLHEHSNGNFGAIHERLPTLFERAAVAPRGFFDRLPGGARLRTLKELPLQHLAIAAGLLIVVVLLVLNRGGSAGDTATTTERASSGSSEQRSVALALPGHAAATFDSADRPAPADAPAPSEPVTKPVPATPAPATRVEPVAKAEPPVKVAPAAKPAPRVEGGQKIALPSASPKAPEPTQNPPVSPPPVNAVASKTGAAATPVVAATPVAAPAVVTKAPVATPVAAPPPVAAKASPAEPNADERELLGWSGKQFALQLLGAGSSATVTKFMHQSTGAVKLYAYRTELNGRPWYIVVTGPYASRNAASAAADTLPAALRNQKPWPRAMKNIHADIKQRK